ncbi:MAG: hypothetical protein ACPG8W_11055 [Candidatus Promineifilaceae bacterium]
MKIEHGSHVTIAVQGVWLTGVVRSASNFGRDGPSNWHIDFDVDGIRRHWKQQMDGGRVVAHRVLTLSERRLEIARSFSRVAVQDPLLARDAARLLRILRGYRTTVADYVCMVERPHVLAKSVDLAKWHPKLQQLRRLFSEPLSAALRNY